MSFKNVLLLFIAVGAASLTALAAKNWISSERAAILASVPAVQPQKLNSVDVLVVVNDLKAGAFVRAENLKWQPWPEEGLADGYVIKGKHQKDGFIGAVVRNAITTGQPITDKRVVHPGERGFLAAVLSPGNRAVSVPVNATSGISGFIFPGDRVDLIVTSKFNARNDDGENRVRHLSRTLLSGIRVLAIDQKTESRDGEVNPAKTVTVEVNPKQAEKVAMGMAIGTLSLSLQSLARDGGKDEPAGSLVISDAGYTMDTEINSMITGFAKTGGEGRKVHVLRGETAEQASF